jgi:aspartate/methionine/tyrosine aminotransferase
MLAFGAFVGLFISSNASVDPCYAQVRGLVFINPGNPTGQCLTEQNLRELIEFCIRERLVLMADEVYQQNVYQDVRPFMSARKVACCTLNLLLFLLGIRNSSLCIVCSK